MGSTTNNKNRFADNCELNENLRYSGLYTDLCGMSVEDFIKGGSHNCCCNGDNNQGGGSEDSGTTPTKKINTLTFKVNQNGNLVAYLAYAPTETIVVSCVCEGTNVDFILNDGGIVVSDVIPVETKLAISNVTFNPMEDEKYKYGDFTIIDKETPMMEEVVYTTYDGVAKFNELSNVINTKEEELLMYKTGNDGVTITFNRPADTEFPEGFDEYSDEEYNNWVAENSYVPLLFVNKERFENGEIKVFIGVDDMSTYFTEIATIMINGDVYSIIVKYTEDESGIEQYLIYNNMKICTFSADGDINVKYIIK